MAPIMLYHDLPAPSQKMKLSGASSAQPESGKRQAVAFGATVDLEFDRGDLKLNKILILEDDDIMRQLLVEYLESVPYEVTAVANGVDGLRRVVAEDFDAIVCDMMMPKLSGDLFYLAVERTKPDHCGRFVFITAHGANEKIRYFIEKIGGSILPKPFHMDELRAAITYVMRDTEIRKAFRKQGNS